MGSMQVGELVWKVTGDNSGLKRSLKQAEGQAGKTGKSFSKMGKIIGGALAAVGLGLFMKKLTRAASDAQETANKFGTVYSKISTQANAVAKDLATNYGLSSQASKELLSSTGDLLTGFGFSQEAALDLSGQVNALAVDLASFTNFAGGAEGASSALTKALLGEREAIKSLGISILEKDLKAYIESSGKAYETATRQEKAQATLALAIAQSGNAIGDFNRSQNDFANVGRRVSSRLDDMFAAAGEKLLPALSELGIAFLNATEDGGFLTEGLDIIVTTVTESIKVIGNLITMLNKLADEETQIKIDTGETRLLSERVAIEKTLAGVIATRNAREQAGNLTRAEEAEFTKRIASERAKLEDIEGKLGAAMTETNKQLDAEGIQREEISGKIKKNSALQDQLAKAYKRTKKEIKETGKAGEKTWNQLTDPEKLSAVNSAIQSIGGSFTSMLSSIAAISAAGFDQQIANIDAQEQRALEAAGVAEETSVERAQRELEIAKEAGDELLIKEKEDALTRAKIQEQFQKKRTKLEYEANLTAWQFQLAQALIQGAMAPLNAYVSTLAIPAIGPALAPINAALAAAAAGLQIAAVQAARPQPPKFAEGGIVPGGSTQGDNVLAAVNSGEMVLNSQQQAQLFGLANGAGAGGSGNITVYLGDELIYKSLYNATQNGELLIDTRAVVD